MTMRIVGFELSVDGMSGYGERDLQPGATARVRLYGQLAAEQADPLVDDGWALTRVVLVRRRQPPRKRKPPPVVVDGESTNPVGHRQADEDIARAAVFPYVDE